jgi:chorismate synthase
VNLSDGQPGPTRYERSDYCPVPRAVPVLEAMLSLALADALIEKLGGDSLTEMQPHFAALRQARLEDLPMDDQAVVWWE